MLNRIFEWSLRRNGQMGATVQDRLDVFETRSRFSVSKWTLPEVGPPTPAYSKVALGDIDRSQEIPGSAARIVVKVKRMHLPVQAQPYGHGMTIA